MSYPAALLDIAAKLSANPADLDALIRAESGWNPNAYNKSGAVGLIQFMPKTLKDFGLLSAALAEKIPAQGLVSEAVKAEVRQEFLMKWPTVEAQLRGPVLTYFSRYKPFPNRQSLFLSVFYPAYRNKPPGTPFPDSVQAQNPKIKTVGDYVAFVEGRKAPPVTIASLALAGAGLLWYIGKRGGLT